jgi:hypothetical protein
MDTLFVLLFLLCFMALIIGLIKPKMVVRWGAQDKRNRRSVLKYYGIGLLLFFVLTGVFGGNTDNATDSGKEIESNTAQEETLDIDKSAATDLDSRIIALGDVSSISLDQSEDVKAIRADYDSLDSKQQSYVTNLAILTNAEDKITELQKEADQEAAAQAQRLTEQLAAAQAEAEAAAAAAAAQQKAELETAQDQNNYTVYITETGEKYHRDGCQYLSKSKIDITKQDAINGGYTPCSKCNP